MFGPFGPYPSMFIPRPASAVGYAPLPVYPPPTLRGTWVLEFDPEYGPSDDIGDPTKPVYELPNKHVHFPPTPFFTVPPGGSPYAFLPPAPLVPAPPVSGPPAPPVSAPPAPPKFRLTLKIKLEEDTIKALNESLSERGKLKYFTKSVSQILSSTKHPKPIFILNSGFPLMGLPARFQSEDTQPIDIYVLPDYDYNRDINQKMAFYAGARQNIFESLKATVSFLNCAWYDHPRYEDETFISNLADKISAAGVTMPSSEENQEKFQVSYEEVSTPGVKYYKYTLSALFYSKAEGTLYVPLIQVSVFSPEGTNQAFKEKITGESFPTAQFIGWNEFKFSSKPFCGFYSKPHMKENIKNTFKSLQSSPTNSVFRGCDQDGKLLIESQPY